MSGILNSYGLKVILIVVCTRRGPHTDFLAIVEQARGAAPTPADLISEDTIAGASSIERATNLQYSFESRIMY